MLLPVEHGRQWLASGWTSIDYTNLKAVVTWGWFRAMIREQPALVANAISDVSTQIYDMELEADRGPTPEELEDLQVWLSELSGVPIR